MKELNIFQSAKYYLRKVFDLILNLSFRLFISRFFQAMTGFATLIGIGFSYSLLTVGTIASIKTIAILSAFSVPFAGSLFVSSVAIRMFYDSLNQYKQYSKKYRKLFEQRVKELICEEGYGFLIDKKGRSDT